MDTSEVYIKMCEKTPLQKLWIPAAWDYIYCKLDKEPKVLSGYDVESGYFGHGISEYEGYKTMYDSQCGSKVFKDDHFCIFRQDQLQALVIDNYISARKMFVHFGFYNTEYGEINYSPEKLWLCFVMEEKYNKVWDGEDWVGKS